MVDLTKRSGPMKTFHAVLVFDGEEILRADFPSYATANSACDEREARYRQDTGAMGYRFAREII